LVVALLATGCGRIDTLRLAHANGGTSLEWPPGARTVELELAPMADGRPWVPVSVDGSATVPFLLQPSAGAIALTGARAPGFGSMAAGALSLREGLLPGITEGLLVKQRRLEFGPVVLAEQSLLLVDLPDWPHPDPRRTAAGVIGFDLFRRATVELDLKEGRMTLSRPGEVDVAGMTDVRRLLVLERVPYFEAWLEPEDAPGKWVRLQFEPAEETAICLDREPGAGSVTLAGQSIEVASVACRPAASAGRMADRDGVFGAAALRSLAVAVDYSAGRIGFRPHD
jgi:hypothetical protein